jgi:hypothetical protein
MAMVWAIRFDVAQPETRLMKYIAPLLLLAACGAPEPLPTGDGNEDAGVSLGSDASSAADAGLSGDDAGGLLLDAGSAETDAGISAECDRDQDGFASRECGGSDCDDSNPGVNPDASERCSFVDENCDEQNNEDLECTFFAHGPSTLYSVDPFAGEVTVIGPMTSGGRNVSLFDIDIDPDGSLIGVNGTQLIRFDETGRGTAIAEVRTPSAINGLAIDSEGTIFLTQSNGSPAQAYTMTLDGTVTPIGSLAPYVSSGDCVVLKNDSLLMTARNVNGGNDVLVYVDSRNAETRLVGTMGAHSIYGLSASFGYLFGLNDEGRVLLVDPETGETEELFRKQSVRFWGAANGD